MLKTIPMNTERVFCSIHKVTFTYKQKLAEISDSNFERSPDQGGWCYSEVYNHIFDLSVLSLKELDNCLDGQGKKKNTHSITKLILFFGAFPPAIRFKVPKHLASRVKKVSKEEASSMIMDFMLQLQPYGTRLAKADKELKTLHPKLGYLNAEQWLRFIEIHLKHHLMQLKRIDKSF
jgi:hypothetical protein